MPSCSVHRCLTGRKKGEGARSFSFPKDAALKKKWLQQIERKTVGNGAVVCEKHFRPGCFISESEKVRVQGRSGRLSILKDTAVPTVFNHFGPPKKKRRAFENIDETPENLKPKKRIRIRPSQHELNYSEDLIHEYSENGTEFQCAKCLVKYEKKYVLVAHIAQRHGLKCLMCTEKYSKIADLKEHFALVHGTASEFTKHLKKSVEKSKPLRIESMKILDASSSETMFHLESKSGENIKSKSVCKEETEKKIKKVVKAKWNGSYSVMVVDGKTYKINDKQRTSLDKIMPKVKSGLASIVSTSSVVRPNSEIKEKTPEERIKELEMKLLAVSKENEAYKKIFKGNPHLDSSQKNVTIHTYHDDMMGIPTERDEFVHKDLATKDVPLKYEKSGGTVWVSLDQFKLSPEKVSNQPKTSPNKAPSKSTKVSSSNLQNSTNYTTNQEKPSPLSFQALIATAITNLPDCKASAEEIYEYMKNSYPFYANPEDKYQWKTSIKNDLGSYKQNDVKVFQPEKVAYGRKGVTLQTGKWMVLETFDYSK